MVYIYETKHGWGRFEADSDEEALEKDVIKNSDFITKLYREGKVLFNKIGLIGKIKELF